MHVITSDLALTKWSADSAVPEAVNQLVSATLFRAILDCQAVLCGSLRISASSSFIYRF